MADSPFSELMVKGSVWKLTKDFECMLSDSVFTVVRKKIRDEKNHQMKMRVQFHDGPISEIPYKWLKRNSKMVSDAPIQYVYVLRDKNTKQYVQGPNSAYIDLVPTPEYEAWSAQRDEMIRDASSRVSVSEWYLNGSNSMPPMMTFVRNTKEKPFIMVEKTNRARNFVRLGNLKSYILEWSGYHMDLDRAGSRTQFEMRDIEHLECVKLEKRSGKEIEIIDLQEWYDRKWETRNIIPVYGKCVHDLCEQLSNKGLLSDYEFIAEIKHHQGSETDYIIFKNKQILKENFQKLIFSQDYELICFPLKSVSEATLVKMLNIEESIEIFKISEIQEKISGA